MDFLRRAWVEIDLNSLKQNYSSICRECKTNVIPVVKADAYGHGAPMVALALQDCGADMFAVSNILEAAELRENGIKGDILVLGYTPAEASELIAEHDVTQCIFSLEYATDLSRKAEEIGVKIKSHLKLDTGMGRIGFDCRSDKLNIKEINSALSLSGLDYTGVFMHFAVADSNDKSDIDFTNEQYKRFCATVCELEKSGFSFKMKHCCNSAGLISYGDMRLDAVRAGIILYGLAPSGDIKISEAFSPVMSMYSVISMIKTIDPENTVSYGRTYKAKDKRKIATLSAGYADGVPRLLSNNGYVLIHGKKAPIVGRICMDQFCVDVTDVEDIKVGDTAEIFGKNLSVDDVARRAQTINYEIICGISKRIPRIYK